MVKVTYKTGDKVFAKVKGYPPWPAQVVGDTGKKKYNVLFYGTQETGAIKPEDLSYYLKYKDSYVYKYMKRAGYEDAVKQIEEAIKKDGGDGNDASNIDDPNQDIEMSDASSVSSASEKKAPKRKVTSLPNDEPSTKKTPAKGRRKSIASVDSKDDNSEEPAIKRPRKKSNASTDENSEELAAKKSRKNSNASTDDISEELSTKKPRKDSIASIESKDEDEAKNSSDNGIKEETQEELQKESEENSKKIEAGSETVQPKDVESPIVEETVSANESEKVEETRKEDVETVQETKDKEKSAIIETETEAKEKTKELESAETNNGVEEIMQIEEEPSTENPKKKQPVKIEIVTEQLLNNYILYAEHVKKHLNLYTGKPVEPRQASKDEVLAVKLPSGTICGVRLHKEWPLDHSNEHDRALYDEKVAKLALEAKELLSSGKSAPDNVEVIPDIEMTLEDVKEISYARDIESKRKRLDRLKKEADLVTWDSTIKNNLGLDKAFPDAALESLKKFSSLENHLDSLTFKKHPHVLDTVRRLRKYVGNMKEWDMSEQDIESFTKKAEKIRNEAEDIYDKIKNVFNIEEEKGLFWDSFMDLVSEFRTKCKDLSESECLVLCAEPDSRQAFFDRLDEVTESEGTNINPSNTSEPVLKETSVQGWSEKK